jgi:C-terminal processing protease CtpA/Prc
MKNRYRLGLIIAVLTASALSCQFLSQTSTPTPESSPTAELPPTNTPTALPSIPVEITPDNTQEPVYITGEIPYTSPFFLNTISEPFVLLEDEAGFVQRDREFQFKLEEQVIGPVVLHDDQSLTYSLSLPTIPQGTFVDVDNNGQEDQGVQVFAIAYWSNIWGGPFLEERDGTGWSTAYASTITDPENDDEIKGGTLIVWAPDAEQSFPTGFGEDGLLFTADDPTAAIPAGYNIVDLNEQPFKLSKVSRPNITLNEGEVAVNDYSDMNYQDAFEALFEKASREYPFTSEKGIDWQSLHDKYTQRIAQVNNDNDFYRAIRDFTYEIPDAHVGVSVNGQVFYEEQGGGFGLVLAELSDGRVIVSQVLPGTPADQAGIERGAEILEWDNQPVSEAISNVVPYLGPFSTEHSRRLAQVAFLTRVPPDSQVQVSFQNPGQNQPQTETMQSQVEYDSLFLSLSGLNQDELALPVQGEILDGSGLGYVRITTFSADYNLMAQLWEHYIQGLIANEVPGLIIDIRSNGGGSGSLALDFAGYFFDHEVPLYKSLYYNERTGKFEPNDFPATIKPGPEEYQGKIAVLVGPDCVSACEGFAYALEQSDRTTIVGNYPTAGAFGEVGRGQYRLPGDITLQFPTGRPETPQGDLLIENSGVRPDVVVPVTEDSVLNQEDAVLNAAVDALK